MWLQCCCTLPQFVLHHDNRLTCVCLAPTGDEAGWAAPLVHTPKLLRDLEMLTAGCQSRRTVHLEGDTCSGKTALVMELARLAGRRLLVVPMTANTGGHGAWRCKRVCTRNAF